MFANNTFETVRQAVIGQVSHNHSFTVPQIARETDLSTTTVSKHLNQLLSMGLIEDLGYEPSSHKGRKAIVYGINPNSHYFIGVDVKNTGFGIGLIDFSGKLLKSELDIDYRFENTYGNLDLVCTKILNFIDSLESEQKGNIMSVGVSLGGRVNSADGTSATIYNFEETQDIPLTSLLSDRIGYQVVIENDTKSLSYADYLATGKKWQNVLYANVGWGLGLGIIINGELYYGSRGFSGEMGHMQVYDNNIICHCGKKGCMETEVSGMAIRRKLVERIKNGEASILSRKVFSGQDMTEEDILEATEREDPLCIELVSSTGRELGKHLAGMLNIFNPDCIIIGGKLSRLSSYYFQQHAAVAVKQHSLKLVSRDIPIIASPLGEKAGIIGAGISARKKFFQY